MGNLASELSGKNNNTGSDFKNKIQNGEQQLERMAHNVGQKVGTLASDLSSSTADSMRQGREYVKENPIKGVAIAAAAGLVAGSLLSAVARGRRE